MNPFTIRSSSFATNVSNKLTYLLILSLVLWSIGAPSFLHFAHAASFTNVSDTLSDSDLSVVSAHTFRFRTQTVLNDTGASDKLTISFIPSSGDNFTVGSLGVSGITASGISVVSSCTAGASEFTLATTSTSIALTICAGDTVAANTNIVLSTATSTITNPPTARSYVERIQTLDQGTTVLDSSDTRVAILNDVVVTASVDTIFTFTVAGLVTSTTYNGITTTGSSTATALAFNTLVPGASSTLAQTLSVATNARNGFAVTVQEDQNLTSSTGADIDLFKDGATTSVPTVWTAPTNVLDQEATYGHFGISSDDTDEGAGEFVGAKFAGNFSAASPRQIFTHSGPADGTTQDKGLAHVFYTIQIGTLQEAGTDYTNHLTYVATPTF